MENGIRSYGPGKFHTILDSHAYEFALDGVDEELSMGDGGGWYGLVQLGSDGADRIREIAEKDKDPLTRDEEHFLDSQAAVIFFERSDGIVEATWYNDELTAQQDWELIEEDFEDEDEDEDKEEDADFDFDLEDELESGAVITDARGGGYSTSFDGKHFEDFDDFDEALLALYVHSEETNYFPNFFYVNDCGNTDLLEVTPKKSGGRTVSVTSKTIQSWT